MKHARIIPVMLIIIIIIRVHAKDDLFWGSMEYMVYSDSVGVWIAHPEKSPVLLYPIPSGYTINDIVLIPERDEILFLENHVSLVEETINNREVERAWSFRNIRSIPNIHQPHVVTVAGHVEKRPREYVGQLYNKLSPSTSGTYVIAQRRNMENIGYDVFKQVAEGEWAIRQSVDQWDWRLPLGWGLYEQCIYDLGLSGDMLRGLSILDINTGESTLEEGVSAGAISSTYDILMTFPTSYGDGSLQQIEFFNLAAPRKMRNRLTVKTDGELKRELIAWNPAIPSVLCPFIVQRRAGFYTALVIISPIDSLNRRHTLSHVISDIEWLPTGDGLLCSSGGKLYQVMLVGGKSEEIQFGDYSMQVLHFAVKWREDVED